MDKISAHISYEEATKSQTAIRNNIANVPNAEQLAAMKLVAEKCFEPIRNHFNMPLRVSSFFRGPELNKAIGGAATSQHMKGEAIDIDAGRDMNLQILEWAKTNLDYDQLLNEYPDAQGRPSWVHISYSAKGNRKQFLVITKK